MPCLLGCLALVAPRLVIGLVWLFSDYLGRAYETWLWPILGFVFMPVTTLAYAWAVNTSPGRSVSGIYLVVVVLAVLFDLGLLGGSTSRRRRRQAAAV
jgi:hypothetical protein